MKQVSYEAFLNEVLPYVRDCPEVAAINAIRNACVEFCSRTLMVRVEMDPCATVAGAANYRVSAPSGYTVAQVLGATLDGCPLTPESYDTLAQIFGPAWPQATGSPRYITHSAPEEILLVPQPVVGDKLLRATLALQPSRASTQVAAFVHERWAEEIAQGARARLHYTPMQPYYDRDAAVAFRVLFQAGCSKAIIEINRGLGRTNLSVQMPRFI